MELSIVWFILLGVLFAGFFFLEGFDYGVGMLLPFVGKSDVERRMIINSIGPVWDGNEVWMITAGGAMFAAFPHMYATLFSGFYLALFLMLMALIVRGVAFEFRSKDENPHWRELWDRAVFCGSLVPALLWGVAMTNLLRGVPIDAKMQYAGSFFDLLSPYTIVGGAAFILIFLFHGGLYLILKLDEGRLRCRAAGAVFWVGLIAAAVFAVLAGMTYTNTDLFAKTGAGVTLLGAVLAFAAANFFVRNGRPGLAFAMSGSSIVLTTAAFFWGLFPRLMVSSLNPDWSLTVYNSASSPYTLKLMTIAAVVLVPVVLAYQIWTYWVFRRPVNSNHLEY